MKKGEKRPMTNENGLTIKQQGFIDDYLFSQDTKLVGNGTQCALKWFDVTDNDENTANVIAVEYLRKPMIKKYMDTRLQNIADQIDEKWIVNKLNWLLDLSIKDKNLAVAKGSIELLGKWKAMFTDKQITQTETIEDIMKEAISKSLLSSDKVADSTGASEPVETKAFNNNDLQD